MFNFVFDVDGTLTPPRQPMDQIFQKFFLEWMKYKNVFLATGSDHQKTIEQVGLEIFNNVTSFNCASNQIFKKGVLDYTTDWSMGDNEIKTLEKLVRESSYPVKTGKHVEIRSGMVNFSIVGRNATVEQRKSYHIWDKFSNERNLLKDKLEKLWPHLEISVGGEISLDIVRKGFTKARVRYILSGDIIFFGDQTHQGGNDFALASVLGPNDKLHPVNKWEDTMSILKANYNG